MVTAKADSETLKRDAARIRELFASLDVDQRAVLIAWAEFYALQKPRAAYRLISARREDKARDEPMAGDRG